MIAEEFTTTRLPRREQLAAWRGWHGSVFDVICPGQPADRGFPATHLHWKLGGLGVSRACSPPSHIERTKAAIRRNPVDHWVIAVNRSTGVEYDVRGSSVTVRAGIPFIFSMADELASTRRGRDSHQCLFFLSRDVFGSIAALLDGAAGTALATPEGRLLADYIMLLVSRLPDLAAQDGARLVTAAEAMVSACLAPLADAQACAAKPIELTLRERVRRAVRTNLRSPLLGPDKLCREAGTSRSQLYRLLESEGGVAHYIQRQRLSQSFALLCDTTNLLPVAKIAEALCFTDASSFSRAFRREFGMSPRDVRTASVAGPRPLPKAAEPRSEPGFGDCLRGLYLTVGGTSVMNSNAATGSDFIAGLFRSHWLLFILLGGLLIAGGAGSIVVPALSSVAPSEVLGVVLVIVGIVQIAQSGKMQRDAPFAWHLTLGFLAAIGGVLIYLDPFPGIVAITILMAIVLALHGVTQVIFAIRVRRFEGWGWFLASGCIALIAAGLLLLKLPYGHTFTPATLGGVSLLFVGWAYVAVALASRRSG